MSFTRPPAWLLTSLVAAATLGCRSTCSLHLRFVCTVPIASAEFFVTAVKACPPGPLAHLAVGTTGDAQYYRVTPTPGGLDVSASFSGKRCRVQTAGWYDVNADGNVNPGDYLGMTPVVEIGEGRDGFDPSHPLVVRLLPVE